MAGPALAQEDEAPSRPPPPAEATAPAPAAPAGTPAAQPAHGDFSVLPDIDKIVHVPDAAKPATGQPLDVEAATQAYLDEIPADAKARSDAYFEGGYWLILVDFLYALVVAAIFLCGRVSANLRDRAQRITRFRWLQTASTPCSIWSSRRS